MNTSLGNLGFKFELHKLVGEQNRYGGVRDPRLELSPHVVNFDTNNELPFYSEDLPRYRSRKCGWTMNSILRLSSPKIQI